MPQHTHIALNPPTDALIAHTLASAPSVRPMSALHKWQPILLLAILIVAVAAVLLCGILHS